MHLLELAHFLATPSLNNEDCSGLYLLATTCSYTGGDVSEVGNVGVLQTGGLVGPHDKSTVRRNL